VQDARLVVRGRTEGQRLTVRVEARVEQFMSPKYGRDGVGKPFLVEHSVETQRNAGVQQRASANQTFHFPEPLLLTAQFHGVRTSTCPVHALPRPKVRRVPHGKS
jgi:hypothetical protein